MEDNNFVVSNTDSIIAFRNWKNYEIDFSKITTLEDVVNVLRGMRITISMDLNDPNPDFAPLLPYLKPKE